MALYQSKHSTGQAPLVVDATELGQFALAGSGRTGRTTGTTTQYWLDAFALHFGVDRVASMGPNCLHGATVHRP